jgi:hypothetical protein
MLQAAKKAKASARDVIEIQARAAHHTEFVSSRLLRRVYTDGNIELKLPQRKQKPPHKLVTGKCWDEVS